MKVFVTGGTGLIGRELADQLLAAGHQLRLWHRNSSTVEPLLNLKSQFGDRVELVDGRLGEGRAEEAAALDGCDAVVHAALWREDRSFQQPPKDLLEYLRVNLMGSIQLIESAMNQQIERFVFVSTCAVHDKILDDRALDETHPLWAKTHYGAHKAAIEKFVHSFGYGSGFPICALRPSGVFGISSPITNSKWYDLIADVVAGKTVQPTGGGKEVHVSDVAKAIRLLIDAPAESITGEAFSCCDAFYSHHDVATLAKRIAKSPAKILGSSKSPKHQIETTKIASLGMKFCGMPGFEQTVTQICHHLMR